MRVKNKSVTSKTIVLKHLIMKGLEIGPGVSGNEELWISLCYRAALSSSA